MSRARSAERQSGEVGQLKLPSTNIIITHGLLKGFFPVALPVFNAQVGIFSITFLHKAQLPQKISSKSIFKNKLLPYIKFNLEQRLLRVLKIPSRSVFDVHLQDTDRVVRFWEFIFMEFRADFLC